MCPHLGFERFSQYSFTDFFLRILHLTPASKARRRKWLIGARNARRIILAPEAFVLLGKVRRLMNSTATAAIVKLCEL